MLRQPEPHAAASGCRRNKQIGFNIAALKQGTPREAQKPSQPAIEVCVYGILNHLA